MTALIRGAGGGGGKSGGGGGRTPVEAPDSLQSRQSARVIDLLSEGEIFGLVDGLKSVYLNDTPILNADGSTNFSGVTIEGRNGTQSQSYIPGFPSVEAEASVGVQVKASAPVVRSITNENANALRITVSVPALTLADISTGDINGSTVTIAIDLQTDGAGFVQVVYDTISGKTTSKYQRAYRIELAGDGPWDVRVRRITADNASSTLANDTYWDSYTEIVDAKLRYPNSAIQALSVQADAFTSIPRRGYEAKGMLVHYPSNYNPVTRAYAGVWNGTWAYGWTNNPAWCFYDVLVQNRYGLGEYLDVNQVDKWALYQIARYCDEIIADGFGGYEPRYTCSLYLQNAEEAFTVISAMASIFCGIAFWAGGAVVAMQDAPSPPVKLFVPANTIDGKFSYSGSSLKSRHTVALVSWNDPADMYRQKIEYVEDREGIVRYGVRQTSVVAIGCTSRGQAHRFGRSLLYTERMETETLAFRTGLDGLDVFPGDVIQTSDPVRAGVRFGGRLLAATATTATLDAPVTLDPAQTYALWVVLPDGTVQSRPVLEGTGPHSVLTVSPAFSAVPQAMAIWTLAGSQLAPETWRVISISEVDNVTAEIAALKYSPNKYAEIEQGIVLEPLPTSSLNTRPAAPTDLHVTESSYPVTTGTLATRITVSWSGVAAYFELQYRRAGGNWSTLSTATWSVDIQPAAPGVYEFSLVGVNTIGARSRSKSTTATIYGLDGPPNAVQGLVTYISNVGVMARWDAPYGIASYDWAGTEIREGATWADGVFKFRGKATIANIGWLPAGLRKVWAAHLNAASVESTPVFTTIQIDAPVQPIVTAEVWRNVVTLRWQDCTASQPIGTYLLRVGPIYAEATEFAQINSTAFERSEATPGTYLYWVIPVDVAGNLGAPGYITVNVLPSIDEALAELQDGLDGVVDQIDDLETFEGKWGVRVVDADGKKISGIILNNDGEQSNFVVLADRFAVAQLVGTEVKYPFVVGLIDGVASIGIDGNMYVDGTIKTRMIEAEAITADKIKAHTITADKVSADFIDALEINVGVGSNLLPNASFAAGSDYWNAYDGITGGANMVFERDGAGSGWVPVSGHTLTIHQTNATDNGGVALWYCVRFPVVAGARYEFSCYTGAHRCSVYLTLEFHDASGTAVSAVSSNLNEAQASGGQLLSGFKRVFGFATAPANAATATLHLRRGATYPGQSDSWGMYTMPYAAEASINQTAPSPWGPSGLGTKITPGGIVTPSLAALSANLGNVTAGTFDLQGGEAGAYGYFRSAGKWWSDGGNGWAFARRGSDGEAFMEMKMGAGRIWMATWGDYGIQFPGILMTAGGLTINQLDVIDTFNVRGNAITVPSAAFTSGAISAGSAQVVAQQASIDLGGVSPPVLVRVSALIAFGSNGGYAVYRDGVLLTNENFSNTSSQISVDFIDYPGGGAHTYQLIIGQATASRRTLSLLACKR